MIRVNRNLDSEKIDRAKEVLIEERNKSCGNYNKPEVIEALKLVFNKKCYICENKKITSYNIEHHKPHRNTDLDLKFDWENLFLSCAHCNNIKSDKYEKILDCTKCDIDELIEFRRIGNFVWEEYIEVKGREDSKEIIETIELLKKVYNGTTKMKKLESSNIRKELRLEIQKFVDAVNEYMETDGEDKEDAELLIKKELKGNSPFAAFKRWMIRDNKENLSKFLEEDSIKCKL